MNFKDLYDILSPIIYLRDDLEEIVDAVNTGEITEEQGYFHLKELEDGRPSSLSDKFTRDWKQLLKVIDRSEIDLKKSIRFQLYLALIELPLALIMISISFHFNWIKGEIAVIIPLVTVIIGTAIIHTFFILRIYQQGATAIERFSEKRIGILFMQTAAKQRHSNENMDKLIDAATLMFLGHHVKPADPFGPKDLPKRIEKKEKDGEN